MVRKYFFSFMYYPCIFTSLFLYDVYIATYFSFTGGIEGKIHGKTRRRCVCVVAMGNVEVGRGVKGPSSGMGVKGEITGTERRGIEQRVLIDTVVLILGNSFYFIRFFFHLFRGRGPREPAPPSIPVR